MSQNPQWGGHSGPPYGSQNPGFNQDGQYGGPPGQYGDQGQFGQPGNQFGQPGNQFFGPQSGGSPQPPQRPRRRFPRWLIRPLLLVLVVAVGGFLYPKVIRPILADQGVGFAQEDEAKAGANTAKVGECVFDKNSAPGASAPADSNDVRLRVVPCDSAEAAYKVLGVLSNKTNAEANQTACDPFPGADTVYWEGVPGRRGLVLCMQELKAAPK